jgi:transposase
MAVRQNKHSKPKHTTNMQSWDLITHYAGFDWAKNHHDIIIVDRQGTIVADFQIEHSSAGWKTWRERIAAYPALALCIETNQGAAIEQLLQGGATLYPVQPKAAQRYRERKAPSGVKTDRLDAFSLADALRVDGHGWKPLAPLDPLIQELRLLCRDEVALIEERTALVNQLQQALYEYYPAALDAFDDFTRPAAWAFVEAFPSPEILVKAGKRKWEKFLHLHKLVRPQTHQGRLEAFAKADQFCASPAVVRAKSRLALARARMLRILQRQLDEYRAEIEKLFAEHPDHDLFGSLPGAGSKLAPRLLSELGSDRSLLADAQALQCLAGTAPVSFQSGQIHKVHLRRHCNKNLRSAVHLWADLSRRRCPWAAAYYQALKQRGKSHACALRCLGQRWLKILWKMWQTHLPYDPELHTRNQTLHGSWVLQLKAA